VFSPLRPPSPRPETRKAYEDRIPKLPTKSKKTERLAYPRQGARSFPNQIRTTHFSDDRRRDQADPARAFVLRYWMTWSSATRPARSCGSHFPFSRYGGTGSMLSVPIVLNCLPHLLKCPLIEIRQFPQILTQIPACNIAQHIQWDRLDKHFIDFFLRPV